MVFFRKNKRQFGIRSHRRVFVALFLVGMFCLTGAISLILNTNAQLAPIREVEIFSQHASFTNNEPGAWKVTKSAEWTDTGKAKIVFEVKSIQKYKEDKKFDILMVIDNSGSMAGNKMDQVKIDATDLVDSFLDDPDNRVALVTFGSSAYIRSGFTNKKSEMLNYISNITATDSTNYYDGFLKAADVLNGYIQQDNRELILLFLTDGYPNIQTPNEVAEYYALKAAYPYMTINGIQYEMGDTILQPIIDISDNQFIADMSSLNNVLFEATTISYLYDDFAISDYINDTYWTVTGIEAIDATLGDINLAYSDATPVITWNMSNLYRSGQTATLTIEVTLKNEYLGQEDLLLPTNTHETIESKLEDNPDEDIDSNNTPILKKVYNVIYNANAPSDCEMSGTVPDTTTHTVFTPVSFSEEAPTCTGYIFAGWKTTNYDISWINNDYFRMPEEDVYVYALWSKPSITKSIDGTTHERGVAILDTGQNAGSKMKVLAGHPNANTMTSDTNITALIRATELSPTVDATDDSHILSSVDSPLPVYGWYDEGVFYFYSEADDIYLNSNSKYLFDYFRSLEDISGLATFRADQAVDLSNLFAWTNISNIDAIKHWNTENVTDMSSTFYATKITNLDALKDWNISNVDKLRSTFGNMIFLENIEGIKDWNVSNATDMYGILANTTALTNIDSLIGWDTGNVTNMGYMFSGSGIKNINGAINWDTSQVTNMNNMLSSSNIENIDGAINWDTSQVTDMGSMLRSLKYLPNIDGARNWNTSSVTDMQFMFDSSKGLENIDGALNWDVSNVSDVWRMFGDTTKLSNIDGARLWNTKSMDDTMYMFINASGLKNIDGAGGCFTNDQGEKECVAHEDGTYGWDMSNVTNMADMFRGASSLENIDGAINWNTGKVTSMSSMFGSAKSLTNIDGAINWNTGKVTSMSAMFAGNSKLNNIDGALNWDTSSVTNMANMFKEDYSLSNIDGARLWDTSNVTNMYYMFYQNSKLINLNGVGGCFTNDQGEKECVAHEDGTYGWDTGKVTNMAYMFGGNGALVNIDGIANWDVKNVTDMTFLFGNDTLIADHSALHSWNTQNVTTMESMFANNYGLLNLDVFENWNTANVKNMNRMFSGAKMLINIDGASNWDTSNVTNMESMFHGNESLENINGALNWDTSEVTNMTAMFTGSKSLKNIDGARLWNTSKVTRITHILSESAIENVDGAGGCFTNDQGEKECVAHEDGTYGWDTSGVTDMSYLFWKDTKLTNLDGVAHWNTENVINMYCIFHTTSSLTDISGLRNWNTGNVQNMENLFNGSGITNVDALSSWNTENVTNMNSMFWNASNLADIDGLSSWNTNKVTGLSYLFAETTALSDISAIENWNTSNVTSMRRMFYLARGITSLEPIFNWNVNSLTNVNEMFTDVPSSVVRPDWYYAILNN